MYISGFRAILRLLALAAPAAALWPQSTVAIRPKEIDDVLINPGIGFMTFKRFNGDRLITGEGWKEANPIVQQPFRGTLETANHPLTSLAYFRLYWKDLEPEAGKPDWAIIDRILRTARERRQTLLLRVVPYGRASTDTNDVPAWYRALVGDETARKLPEKWRTDPENPLYTRYWTRFIRALGERYDGHPDLEMVDVSIVGAWGEGAGTDQLSDATLKSLLDSYLDSFHRTPLLMQMPQDRRGNFYALSRKAVGWRADCLGDLRWPGKSGFCHMFDMYPQRIIAHGLQDAWKTAPVSFESCWVMEEWKARGFDLDYIIEQSLKWHISSFNNKSGAVPPEWRPKVDQWLKRMGYRFVLRKFTYPATVAARGRLAFTSWWENKGVAPCYKPLTLALRLKGPRTVVLATGADVRTWLPGDAIYDGALFLPEAMPAGDYELGIALVDPQTREPKVKLAIEGLQPNGWYGLGPVKVQ